jgi:hypothetical protein
MRNRRSRVIAGGHSWSVGPEKGEGALRVTFVMWRFLNVAVTRVDPTPNHCPFMLLRACSLFRYAQGWISTRHANAGGIVSSGNNGPCKCAPMRGHCAGRVTRQTSAWLSSEYPYSAENASTYVAPSSIPLMEMKSLSEKEKRK